MARIRWIETGHSVKLSRRKKKKKKECEIFFHLWGRLRSAFQNGRAFISYRSHMTTRNNICQVVASIESLIAKLFGYNAFDVQTSRCSRILDNDRERIFSSSLSIDSSYRRGRPFSSFSLSLSIFFYPKKENIGWHSFYIILIDFVENFMKLLNRSLARESCILILIIIFVRL